MVLHQSSSGGEGGTTSPFHQHPSTNSCNWGFKPLMTWGISVPRTLLGRNEPVGLPHFDVFKLFTRLPCSIKRRGRPWDRQAWSSQVQSQPLYVWPSLAQSQNFSGPSFPVYKSNSAPWKAWRPGWWMPTQQPGVWISWVAFSVQYPP